MIIVALLIFGIILGSFVNALVWRTHEQAIELSKKKPRANYVKQLSISRGRSMCTHCKHELSAFDLVPVLSWLYLRGRCRYCKRPIADSPVVEVGLALSFVASYVAWTVSASARTGCYGHQAFACGSWLASAGFIVWLTLLTILMALVVYDLRWMLLPNKLLVPLGALASIWAAFVIFHSTDRLHDALFGALSVIIGGGIFYVIFHASKGKWIGGGDVRLGWILGLIVLTPARSLLVIFLAAIFGSIVSIPLLLIKRLKANSTLPFGPFLILACVVTVLWGAPILHWYEHLTLFGT